MSAQDAWYYATHQGQRMGPITYQELRDRVQTGEMNRDDLVWAGHLLEWTPLERIPELAAWARPLPPTMPSKVSVKDRQEIIDSTRMLELISAIVWCVIAAIQILVAFKIKGLVLVMLIAGVSNMITGIFRFSMIKKIQERQKRVVAHFEKIHRLLVIGLINLFFGAFIGTMWVIFDFIIRDKVLKNHHLFDQ